MKTLFTLATFYAAVSYGHCPIRLETENASFCAEIQWEVGEFKRRGQWSSSENLSPWLILKNNTVPQTWNYSRALITIWEKGDTEHKSAHPQNFRIFPYMNMEDGMHHDADAEFQWRPHQNAFEISKMAFNEMEGCWSLRWTQARDNQLESSQMFLKVNSFTNTSGSQILSYCDTIIDNAKPGRVSHEGHHH